MLEVTTYFECEVPVDGTVKDWYYGYYHGEVEQVDPSTYNRCRVIGEINTCVNVEDVPRYENIKWWEIWKTESATVKKTTMQRVKLYEWYCGDDMIITDISLIDARRKVGA